MRILLLFWMVSAQSYAAFHAEIAPGRTFSQWTSRMCSFNPGFSSQTYGPMTAITCGESGNAGPDFALAPGEYGQTQKAVALYVRAASLYGNLRPGVVLRGSAEPFTGYGCQLQQNTDLLLISRINGSAHTVLVSQPIVLGPMAVLVGQASGSTITCSVLDPVTGNVIASVEAADTTYSGARVGVVGECTAASACRQVYGVYAFAGGDAADVPDWIPLQNRQWYVGPQGTAPWYQQASASAPHPPEEVFLGTPNVFVQPGQTVWLRGGRYTPHQPYVSKFFGQAAARITIRPVPGEIPLIDGTNMESGGAITVNGSAYLDVFGIWYVYEGPRIKTIYNWGEEEGNAELTQPFLCAFCQYCRFANAVVQASGDVLGFATSTDTGTEFREITVLESGTDNHQRSSGSSGYSQNTADKPEELYRHIIAMRGWRGFHQFYASSNLNVQRMAIEESIYVDGMIYGGWSTGGVNTVGGRIERSWFMSCPVVPYISNRWDGGLIADNFIAQACTFGTGAPSGFSGATLIGNRCIGGCTFNQCSTLADGTTPCSSNTVSGNTGVEAHLKVVWPNDFEPGWAILAVWNADGKTEEEFDVSSILPDNTRWVVYDAYNPYIGPTQAGMVERGTVKLQLDASVEPRQPIDQTIPCWYYNRSDCLTSGTYTYVVPTASQLPASANLGETALAADTYYPYYWNGTSWVRAENVIMTHQRPLTFSRVPKLFVYLLRTAPRAAERVTVVYAGSESDTLEAGRLTTSGLDPNAIVLEKSCADGVCTAQLLTDGGRVWWRVNGGELRVAEVM